MSSNRRLDVEPDEPPFVTATLMRAGTLAGGALRRTLQALGHRLQLWLWAAATATVFLTTLVLAVLQTPDWTGVVQGLFAGLFMALLVAAGVGWLLLWARGRPAAPDVGAASRAAALETLLAPTLRELTAVRRDVARRVKARSIMRVPLAVAVVIVLWFVSQSGNDPPGVLDLVGWIVVGAVVGEIWAIGRLEREYHRLYKSRVLPVLAARFGALTYREAAADRVHQLRSLRILPQFDTMEADDEIAGRYHDMPLSIVEARLRQRSGDSSRVVFDGLLVDLALPRTLTGTTAVVTDEGRVGNLAQRWRAELQQVRLEDPRFESRFEVYSSDQIEARALLTPAFMERFVALASETGFSLPGALAEGNRLVIALPKALGTGNLFEPPAYWKAAGGQALVALERDIAAVLRMADAVIALDFWATGRRATAASVPPDPPSTRPRP